MTKIITLYDTTGFRVMDNTFIELLSCKDLGEEKVEFKDISYKEESVEFLKHSKAVVWTPSPTELINIGNFEISLTKDNYFERIKRDGFEGKRILYLPDGFSKKHFQYSLIPCEVDFSRISDHHVFFLRNDSRKRLAELIKNF
ncbi:MAG: hypothetical protein ABIJ14_03110 [Nanoarchaeota archaeon]|nr:hypothetical protein [Nanoarchaeota archaeon]